MEQNADIGTKVYLVVNKCDLQEDQTVLSRTLVDQFCQLHNLEQFNVSAKTGEGVNELMQKVVDDFAASDRFAEDDQALVEINTKTCFKRRGCC